MNELQIMSSAVMHINAKSVPRQSLLALFVLGKLCHMSRRVCVLQQVGLLCNFLDVIQQYMRNRQMTTAS